MTPHATLLNVLQAAKGEAAKVAVLGASGYTGAEVVRLTALHPGIQVTALTGEKQAGKVRDGSTLGFTTTTITTDPPDDLRTFQRSFLTL